MHHFEYRGGVLHGEDVNLEELAAQEGTPFYCYSSATLERHYNVFADAFDTGDVLICYAMKANSSHGVLRTLARLGAGMDVVSQGELLRAKAVGVPGNKILFSGVGKTAGEMKLALDMDILCFNVESEPELDLLSAVASQSGSTASISLRINPDVDPGTHEKISTGRATDKFGIPWHDARRVYAYGAKLPGLRVTGVDMHIGSQITQLEPFTAAFTRLRDLVGDLRADGHAIEHVDFGGGLGIPYGGEPDEPPHPRDYARAIFDIARSLDVRMIFEPGRMIAGNAGILVSRVIYIKESNEKRFAIVDAGMNDLVRPTLYEAFHEIIPVKQAGADVAPATLDVVGPVCETGDYFAKARQLPPLESGDLIAILSAGAYGAVQAGTYNSRPLIPEILIKGERYALTRKRQSYEDMLAREIMPTWLT